MIIKDVTSGYYRIPLLVRFSDATHGLMEDFELGTVKITTDSGHEGVGYTYTPGTGGTAIHSAIKDVLGPLSGFPGIQGNVISFRAPPWMQVTADFTTKSRICFR